MILNEKDLLSKKKYKILICGSGPAGLTIALELEKKN